MEILLILILLTLVYIALQLRKLAKPTVDIDKPLNTTTLTPVFSETEIRENKDLAQTWQEQVKKAFDALGKVEHDEIKKYMESGGTIENFIPSSKLLNAIYGSAMAIFCKFKTDDMVYKMIAMNASVLSHEKTIREAKDDYAVAYGKYYYLSNTDLWLKASIFATQGGGNKEMAVYIQKFEREVKEKWLSSWGRIISDDFLPDEKN